MSSRQDQERRPPHEPEAEPRPLASHTKGWPAARRRHAADRSAPNRGPADPPDSRSTERAVPASAAPRDRSMYGARAAGHTDSTPPVTSVDATEPAPTVAPVAPATAPCHVAPRPKAHRPPVPQADAPAAPVTPAGGVIDAAPAPEPAPIPEVLICPPSPATRGVGRVDLAPAPAPAAATADDVAAPELPAGAIEYAPSPVSAAPAVHQPDPPRPEPRETRKPAQLAGIEQLFEQARARHVAEARALREELSRRAGGGGDAEHTPSPLAAPTGRREPRSDTTPPSTPHVAPPQADPVAAPQAAPSVSGGGGTRPVRSTRPVLWVAFALPVLLALGVAITGLLLRHQYRTNPQAGTPAAATATAVLGAVVDTLGGWLGVPIAIALIALLVVREFARAAMHGPRPGWLRALDLGIAPLLLLFIAVAAIRLIGATREMPTGQGAAAQATPRAASATPAVGVVAPAAAATAIAAPSPAPPSTPAPTSTPAPSTAPDATGTAPARSAPAVLQQVAAAEAALRTGRFEATIDYGNGNRSWAQVRFDRGGDQAPPRLHIITTSDGPAGGQALEHILIGDRGWKRQPDSRWAPTADRDGVWEQVSAYLPQVRAAADPQLAGDGGTAGTTVLRWYDPDRNADTTLETATATATPLRMRQAERNSPVVLTVTYRDWNTPVDIAPPAP